MDFSGRSSSACRARAGALCFSLSSFRRHRLEVISQNLSEVRTSCRFHLMLVADGLAPSAFLLSIFGSYRLAAFRPPPYDKSTSIRFAHRVSFISVGVRPARTSMDSRLRFSVSSSARHRLELTSQSATEVRTSCALCLVLVAARQAPSALL